MQAHPSSAHLASFSLISATLAAMPALTSASDIILEFSREVAVTSKAAEH